jgi:hypothetical protein
MEQIVWVAEDFTSGQNGMTENTKTWSPHLGGLNRKFQDGAEIDRVRFTAKANIGIVADHEWEDLSSSDIYTNYDGLQYVDESLEEVQGDGGTLPSSSSDSSGQWFSNQVLTMVGMEIQVRDETGMGARGGGSGAAGYQKYTHLMGYWKITPPNNVIHEENVTNNLITGHKHGLRLPLGIDFTLDLPFHNVEVGDTITFYHYGRKYIATFCCSTTGDLFPLNNSGNWKDYFNKARSEVEPASGIGDYSLGAQKLYIGIGTSNPGDYNGRVNDIGFYRYSTGTNPRLPYYIEAAHTASVNGTAWPSGMTLGPHGGTIPDGTKFLELKDIIVYKAGEYRVSAIKEYRDEYQQLSLKKERGGRTSHRRAHG